MSLVKRYLEDVTLKLMDALEIVDVTEEDDSTFEKIERWLMQHAQLTDPVEEVINRFRDNCICPQCMTVTFGKADGCTTGENMKSGDKVTVTLDGKELKGTVEVVGYTYDGSHRIKTECGRTIMATNNIIKETK